MTMYDVKFFRNRADGFKKAIDAMLKKRDYRSANTLRWHWEESVKATKDVDVDDETALARLDELKVLNQTQCELLDIGLSLLKSNFKLLFWKV